MNIEKKNLPCGRVIEKQLSPPSNEQLKKWNEQLRAYLVSEKLKYTEQRWKIAKLILSHTGHLSSQELVTRVRSEHPEMGIATVYRNIKVLCDAKILKESLVMESGLTIYEIFDDHHHDHMVCMDCGEIFEFNDDSIEQAQNRVIEKQSFLPVSHKHVLYVRCARIHKSAGPSVTATV